LADSVDSTFDWKHPVWWLTLARVDRRENTVPMRICIQYALSGIGAPPRSAWWRGGNRWCSSTGT